MSTRNLNHTEDPEDWLRSAARDAFDAIDRQEGTRFSSIDDLADFINQAGEKLIAERKHGT